MTKKTFNLLSGLLIVLLIGAGMVLLSNMSFRQSLAGPTLSSVRPELIPLRQTYLPVVVVNEANALRSSISPIADSDVITPPNEQVNEDVEPIATEPFHIIPYQRDPLPSFDPVSPELDNIKLKEIFRLELPKGEYATWGNTSWSPDSNRFVGHYFAVVDGKESNQLYIGDVVTGKISLWRQNGLYPIWSRDSRTILYLRPRADGAVVDVGNGMSRIFYDLLSGEIDSEHDDIVMIEMAPPYFPLQQQVQTAEGNILSFDHLNQLVVYPAPSELINLATQGIQPVPITNLSQLDGLLQYPPIPVYDEKLPAFSINQDGTKILFMRYSQPTYLIDLAQGKVEAQLDSMVTPHNMAWSADGKSVAFANPEGLYRFDLRTYQLEQLITKSDFKFAEEGQRNGFATPAWGLDNQVIFFMAASTDWVKPEIAARIEFYTFAMNRDSKAWKTISEDDLISLSPSGLYAIMRSGWETPDLQYNLIQILAHEASACRCGKLRA